MTVTRFGGVALIAGVVVLVAASMLHPMEADPNDSAAAFAEYAADRLWISTHLIQLGGAFMMTAGLIAFSWKLRTGRAAPWALVAGTAALTSLAAAAALQAVDGVALKALVDRWHTAPLEARAPIFEAAFAVRQIEIGLASVATIFFGVGVVLYGVAILFDVYAPNWVGVFGAMSGSITLASGIGLAHAGFSSTAMGVNMWSTLLALLWCLCVAVVLFRDSTGATPSNL
ncbi:MAG TPA: hypothetical protein VFB75_08680 [Burkholderiales bacterium]|nr:hypothetical protein [Burkholderiales bacterium]